MVMAVPGSQDHPESGTSRFEVGAEGLPRVLRRCRREPKGCSETKAAAMTADPSEPQIRAHVDRDRA